MSKQSHRHEEFNHINHNLLLLCAAIEQLGIWMSKIDNYMTLQSTGIDGRFRKLEKEIEKLKDQFVDMNLVQDVLISGKSEPVVGDMKFKERLQELLSELRKSKSEPSRGRKSKKSPKDVGVSSQLLKHRRGRRNGG